MTAARLPLPDFPQDDVYHAYTLCYARMPERRVHENFLRPEPDLHDGPMPVDFNIWILRNAHRTVLVDTGFGQRAVSGRGRPLDVDVLEALDRLGIPPDSIEDIVITHLHWDHAGNVDRFARARFHVQDAEVNFATGRCMCDLHLRRPYDVEEVVALVRHTYADRVRFHAGDSPMLPGISLHAVPGHTLGMQAVRVMTPRGPLVLASDSSHYYINLARRSPFSLTVDAISTLRSYDKLLELAGGSVERIVPGHDPRVRELYPSREFAGIALSVLHEAPRPHDLEMMKRLH